MSSKFSAASAFSVYKVSRSGRQCSRPSRSLAGSPRASSSPASSTHGKCPTQVYHFFILHTVFLLFLFCVLNRFKYTNIYHYVTIAYSIQYGNMLYSLVAQMQSAIPYSLVMQQTTPVFFNRRSADWCQSARNFCQFASNWHKINSFSDRREISGGPVLVRRPAVERNWAHHLSALYDVPITMKLPLTVAQQ